MPEDARADLGPTLPPRGQVYATACEVLGLARLAVDLSLAGPNCDLQRAWTKLNQIRALLPEGQDPDDSG